MNNINLKSGIRGDSCNLRIASGPSLSLYLVLHTHCSSEGRKQCSQLHCFDYSAWGSTSQKGSNIQKLCTCFFLKYSVRNVIYYIRHVPKTAKSDSWLLHGCLSVCLSTRPHEITLIQLGGFSRNLTSEYFRKSAEKIKFSLKVDKNNGHFTWSPLYIFYYISLISS